MFEKVTPRVRFAPAPSGTVHVGNVRAALYNWLYARGTGGVFVLRIEDTDITRATDEAVDSLLGALRWLELDWDEGPDVGGSFGPYRQSQRAALYAAVVRRLTEAGRAFRDWATSEELETYRAGERKAGRPPVLKGPVRPEPRPGQTGGPAVRMRTPESGRVVVDDLVRGQITFDWHDVGDFVIQRADGSATYPLANAVDDVAQGITLVCRGEDLLSVTPRQLLVYEALVEDGLVDEALIEAGMPARHEGWEPPARFAHLPLVVGEDRKPLSKRHGSVAVQEFAAHGYLPEVLLNYLALLGWGPADGRERLTVNEMIETFDVEAVGTTAAAFDEDKLAAFNGERIRELNPDELADRLVPFLDGTHGPALVASPPTRQQRNLVRRLVPLVHERLRRLDEVQDYALPFFEEDIDLVPASVDKVLAKPGAADRLEAALAALESLGEWTAPAIEDALRRVVDERDSSARKVFQPVRVAVTGSHVSPPLFESLELIGRERSLARIREAIPAARKAAER